MRRTRTSVLAAAVLAATVWGTRPAVAATFTVGQKVEVREGDTWSAATVLKQEGRRYQVHYEAADAAADEWVTTDRLRLPGTAPATTTRPAATPKLKFAVKDRVEFKDATTWKKATVTNIRDGWYLIQDDKWPGDMGKQWVEADRVRAVGSTEDTHDGWADTHPYHRGEGPPAGKAADGKAGRGGGKVAAVEFPLVEADVAGMATVDAESAAGDWTFKPTPPPVPPKELSAKTVVLRGGDHGFFEKTTGLTISSFATPVAAVFYEDGDPGNAVQCQVERIDLLTGENKGVTVLPAGSVPLAIGPDGTQLICRSQLVFGADGQRQVHLFALDKSGPRHVVSWAPYTDRNGSDGAVKRAEFVDPSHVLTVSEGNVAVLWDVPADGRPPRGVYSVKPGFGSLVQLSPDKRVLVTASTKGLHLLDPLTGSGLGTIEGGGLWMNSVGVAAGGGQFVVNDFGVARVYDGATGQPTHTVATGGLNPFHASADVTPGDMLLLNGSHLYDPARRIGVWDYQLPGEVHTCYFAGRLYYMPAGGHPTGDKVKTSWLASAVVPHQQAIDAADAARDEDLFVIRPGITVSLDVTGIQGTDDDRDRVRDGLLRVLNKNRFAVADNAPIKVTATFATAPDQQVTYHFHGQRPDETVSVKQFAYKLEVTDAAATAPLWTRTTGNGVPQAVWLKKDETAADVVAKMSKPDLDYFEHAGLPEYVQRGGEGATLGKTVLTSGGLAMGGKGVQPPAGTDVPPVGHRPRRR